MGGGGRHSLKITEKGQTTNGCEGVGNADWESLKGQASGMKERTLENSHGLGKKGKKLGGWPCLPGGWIRRGVRRKERV